MAEELEHGSLSFSKAVHLDTWRLRVYLGDVRTGGARAAAVAPDAGLTGWLGKCDYDMLRWLVEEGCPKDSSAWSASTSGKYGAVDVERLKWAHEQGLRLSEQWEAAIARNDPSARWLRENGCQFDEAVYLALRHTRYLMTCFYSLWRSAVLLRQQRN